MKRITIIVPCYNEHESLQMFYDEVVKYIDNPKYDFELLFINDGSKDNTLAIIRELSAKDKRVGYISFSRNFGKEAAMQAGLVKCRDNDAVIMIDADLQHPPHLIPEMISYWEDGYKLIYTKFSSRKGEPILKKFFANMFYRLFRKFSSIELEQSVKDFQLLDKKVIDAYLSIKDQNRFVKGMFAWVGFEKKCITFDFVERKAGKTTWSFSKLFKYAFNGINQYSKVLMALPLVAIFFVSLVIVADIVLYVLTACNVAQLMELPSFLLQLQINLYMLILLVILYFLFYIVYQTREETMKRPIYIVDEESDSALRIKERNNE